MDPIEKIGLLAKQYFTNQEYVKFVDLFAILNERIANDIVTEDETTKEKDIKYPYQIELVLNTKLFRHNQLGERVELIKVLEFPFTKKVMIGEEPLPIIESIVNAIQNI